MKNKVTIVGAGSVYTPELVTEFFKDQGKALLPFEKLTLYDIDERRLEILAGLTRRMARRQGVGARIEATTDVNEAVRDASFVITQIRVGGNKARYLDEKIPLQYGVIGQETTGPGGMFKALRTIPEIVKVAKAVKKHAPRAWTLSFTNPSGLVAEGVQRAVPGSRLFGVCSIQVGREGWAAGPLHVPESRIRVKSVGLNHLSWVYRAYKDGKDVTDRMLNGIKKWGGWDGDLLRAIRGLPVGYLWYYYRADEAVRHAKHDTPRAKKVLAIEKILLKRYADPTLDEMPKELEMRGGAGYSVMIGTYIRALTGRKPVTIPTCVPNRGAVEGFGDDQVLEIPARISAKGAEVLRIPNGEIPEPQMGLMRKVKAYETLTAEAALTGSYSKALAAMVTHPLVPNYATGRKILDAMLKAHKKHLPQFR